MTIYTTAIMPRLIACISDYLISKDRQSVHSHFVGLTSCVPTFMSDLVQNFPSAQPSIVHTICYVAANAFVRCGIHVFTSFLSNRPNGYIDIIKKGGTIYSKSFLLFLPSIDICKNTSAPQ